MKSSISANKEFLLLTTFSINYNLLKHVTSRAEFLGELYLLRSEAVQQFIGVFFCFIFNLMEVSMGGKEPFSVMAAGK